MSWNDVEENKGGNNGGDKKDIEFLTLSVGNNQIRFLEEEPETFWQHWIPTANGGKGISAKCIGAKNGCPVCAHMKELGQDKGKWSLRKVHTINVLDRKDGKVKLLQKGNSLFQDLKVFLLSMGDLRNYDVNIVRTGKGFNDTKYTIIPVMNSAPVPADLELYNLKEIFTDISKDEMIILMNGGNYADISKLREGSEPAIEGKSVEQNHTEDVDFF